VAASLQLTPAHAGASDGSGAFRDGAGCDDGEDHRDGRRVAELRAVVGAAAAAEVPEGVASTASLEVALASGEPLAVVEAELLWRASDVLQKLRAEGRTDISSLLLGGPEGGVAWERVSVAEILYHDLTVSAVLASPAEQHVEKVLAYVQSSGRVFSQEKNGTGMFDSQFGTHSFHSKRAEKLALTPALLGEAAGACGKISETQLGELDEPEQHTRQGQTLQEEWTGGVRNGRRHGLGYVQKMTSFQGCMQSSCSWEFSYAVYKHGFELWKTVIDEGYDFRCR